MELKLNFLREYNENIRLVSPDEVDNINIGLIPNIWQELFKEHDKKKRIQKMLSEWRQHVGTNLCNTISYLDEYLEDIELMEFDSIYSILYTIKNSKGEYLYYEGRNPQDSFENEELELLWKKNLDRSETSMRMSIMNFMIIQVNLWD